MNKQKPGIEWTNVYGAGTGYTWNVVQGCQHDCKWEMGDGSIAQCYAKTVAEKFRSDKFMPQGFEHHYFNHERLSEPLDLKTPAGIFIDSVSDLMGHWVPDGQINAVFDICRQANWHTFQLLTKNAPRLSKFRIPHNVWVGVSAPPSQMMGRTLTQEQKERMVKRQLDALRSLSNPVKWMSIEPLSFDIAPLLQDAWLEWAVIGAATNGRKTYQPDARWVTSLLKLFDMQGTAVFFKGNLDWPESAWREDYPTPPKRVQRSMFELLA